MLVLLDHVLIVQEKGIDLPLEVHRILLDQRDGRRGNQYLLMNYYELSL